MIEYVEGKVEKAKKERQLEYARYEKVIRTNSYESDELEAAKEAFLKMNSYQSASEYARECSARIEEINSLNARSNGYRYRHEIVPKNNFIVALICFLINPVLGLIIFSIFDYVENTVILEHVDHVLISITESTDTCFEGIE